MPWTGPSFAAKHNHNLSGPQADKAAKIATAMVEKGVDEGVAIATANKRATIRGKAKAMHRRGLISDREHEKLLARS